MRDHLLDTNLGLIGDFVDGMVMGRDMEQVKASSAVRFDEIFAIGTSRIVENLGRLGVSGKVAVLPKSRNLEGFSDWYNPSIRADVSEFSLHDADLIIDFGFEKLEISNSLHGLSAQVGIGLRVVDAKSGKVLARAFSAGMTDGMLAGGKIDVGPSDKNYGAALKAAFKNVINGAIDDAISRMTSRSNS